MAKLIVEVNARSLESDALAHAIRQATRRAGVGIGARLQSERSLARTLRVPQARVRKAFRTLVEEGILVQRRGSGTFLHRLPSAEVDSSDATGLLAAKDLFDPRSYHSTADSRSPVAQLDLGLWWDDLSVMSPVQQQVLVAMLSAVERKGHRLSLHTVDHQGDRRPVAQSILHERVRQQPRDGYLVSGFISGAFETIREPDWPVVYFASDSKATMVDPCVSLDTQAGVELAMQHLHEAGCQRVAMLYRDSGEDAALIQRYEAMAACLGQSYRRAAPTRRSPDDVLAVVLKRLSAQPQPDGLYVADQHLLPGVLTALSKLRLTPGREMALVVNSNRGMPLAGHDRFSWSRVEYDLGVYANTAVNKLIESVHDADQRRGHIAIRPGWVQGQTHSLSGP